MTAAPHLLRGVRNELSAPNSKAGKLQRACLEILREHDASGAIPKKPDKEGGRRADQDLGEALFRLREIGA